MTPKIVLKPFTTTSFDPGSYAVTTLNGSWTHTNAEVHKALGILANTDSRPRSAAEFISLLSSSLDHPEEMFDKLKSELKLFQAIASVPKIHQIFIMADSDDILETLTEASKSFSSAEIRTGTDISEINSSDQLIIGVFCRYSPQAIRALYNNKTNADRLFLLGYIDRRSLNIDSIHDNRATMPCHFCRRMHYSSQSEPYQNNVEDANTIFDTISEFEKLSDNVVRSLPLTKIEEGLVIFHMSREIERIINPATPFSYHEDVSKHLTIDLSTGRRVAYPAAFHPLCGCWNC